MSNMFKSEKMPRKSPIRDDTRNNSFNFRGLTEKKKVEVELKDSDFPELVPAKTAKEETDMNFKCATLKENIEEHVEQIPFGWVVLYYNDGEIVVQGHRKTEDEEDEENCHRNALHVFDYLINKWEQNKADYDDLHGDGEYDRVYAPDYESIYEDDEFEN
jgi:hypothetical protein